MGNCFRLVCRLQKIHLPSRSERVPVRPHAGASPGKLVLSQKALSITLMVVLALLAFSYLMLVNGRVTKGFEIKDLENRIAELEKTQKQLERESAELQSIQNIEQSLNLVNFTPTVNVSYLKGSGDSLTALK